LTTAVATVMLDSGSGASEMVKRIVSSGACTVASNMPDSNTGGRAEARKLYTNLRGRYVKPIVRIRVAIQMSAGSGTLPAPGWCHSWHHPYRITPP
jgi:hypothetical protein